MAALYRYSSVSTIAEELGAAFIAAGLLALLLLSSFSLLLLLLSSFFSVLSVLSTVAAAAITGVSFLTGALAALSLMAAFFSLSESAALAAAAAAAFLAALSTAGFLTSALAVSFTAGGGVARGVVVAPVAEDSITGLDGEAWLSAGGCVAAIAAAGTTGTAAGRAITGLLRLYCCMRYSREPPP